MVVVRYVALAALVVWLGGLVDVLYGDLLPRWRVVAFACGGLVLTSLLAMKFVGPPPRAFVARTAIVLLMLAIVGYAAAVGTPSPLALRIATALGFVLLFWYVRE
jgi:hypothetical protein